MAPDVHGLEYVVGRNVPDAVLPNLVGRVESSLLDGSNVQTSSEQ